MYAIRSYYGVGLALAALVVAGLLASLPYLVQSFESRRLLASLEDQRVDQHREGRFREPSTRDADPQLLADDLLLERQRPARGVEGGRRSYNFV